MSAGAKAFELRQALIACGLNVDVREQGRHVFFRLTRGESEAARAVTERNEKIASILVLATEAAAPASATAEAVARVKRAAHTRFRQAVVVLSVETLEAVSLEGLLRHIRALPGGAILD